MVSIAIDRTDGLSSSTAIKGPVKAATTANITLSGEQTIDGVSLVTGDRVLVKNQTTASENGIYVVDTGSWRRARDFAGNRDVRKGSRFYVTDGTTNGGFAFYVSTADPITVGTTALSFTQDGAGGIRLPSYTATQIADASHAVNTTDKAAGKIIFDSTNGRVMVATGGSGTSNWSVADGSATVTPS